MVAIFTGLGAGFERGSGAALGSGGLLGSSSLGRGGEGVFLNAANGNLVLNRQDEFLVGRGPDIAIARTYNSQGQFGHDDNGDLWRQSTDRRIIAAGTSNVVGHTVSRLSADGSEITYEYKEWAPGDFYYRTTDGAGAHDKLEHVGGDWIWTDGSSQMSEVYRAADGGWISEVRDTERNGAAHVNKVTFTYLTGSPGKLDTVATADGAYTQYAWNTARTHIKSVLTGYVDYADGDTPKTLTRTTYEYERPYDEDPLGPGRLAKVITDLSPEDNAIGDGKTYWIAYTYDGVSNRVASITQKDGSALEIHYDGSNRVDWLRQTVAGSETRTTTLSYVDEGGGLLRTEITDPRGNITKLWSRTADDTGTALTDERGQLVRVMAPPATTGETPQEVNYTYDGDGNVTSVITKSGATTLSTISYHYDERGNVTQITDANGNVTTRSYDAANNLELETRTGSASSSASTALYTRYVYDIENHLRFAIGGEGRVTEYTYTPTGQVDLVREFTKDAHRYETGATVPALSAMEAWVTSLGDLSSAKVSENVYDLRGNLKETRRFGAATSGGLGAASEGTAKTTYAYDLHGRLLSRQVGAQASESFVYDGLDRLILSTDLAGGTTSIAFADAANTTTVVTLAAYNATSYAWEQTADSYVTISTYNKAGELISRADSGSIVGNAQTWTNGGTARHQYDKNGQLRVTTDATGRKSYFLYDKTGRKVADIGHDGQLIEYRYDQANRLVATARYQDKLTSAQLTTLGDPDSEVEIASIRPTAHSWDIWQWSVYDAGGRVIETILGDGSVTTYEYDQGDRLVKTLGFANRLSSPQIAGFMTTPPAAPILPTGDANKDRVTRTFYDRDGLLIGSLNAEGALSRVLYDSAGQKVQEIAYANLTEASLRATGTFDQLLASFSADPTRDASTRYVYDGQGMLRFTIDALNRVSELIYWGGTDAFATGLVRKTIVYAAPLGAVANYNYGAIETAVSALVNSTNDRIAYSVYNDRAQLAYTVDATGAVTRFVYDSNGRVIRTIQYAAFYDVADLGTDVQWEGNLDTWASANGVGARITRTYYNERGEVRYVIDAESYVTQNDYDQEGRLAAQYRYSAKLSAANDSWTMADVAGAEKDSAVSTQYAYDNIGRVGVVTDAVGTRRAKVYRANGTLEFEAVAYEQNGEARTQYFYDQAGRLVTVRVSPDGSTNLDTVHAYDGQDNLISTTEPGNRVTSFAYDKVGRLTTRTDALGGVTEFEYDTLGRGVKVTDARGNASYSFFDQMGRVTHTLDAEGYVTETTYTAFSEAASTKRYANRELAAFAKTPWFADPTAISHEMMDGSLVLLAHKAQGQMFAPNAWGVAVELVNGDRADGKTSVSGGDTLTFTFDAKRLSAGLTVQARFYVLHADGSLTSEAWVTQGSDGWQTMSATITAAADAVAVNLGFFTYRPDGNVNGGFDVAIRNLKVTRNGIAAEIPKPAASTRDAKAAFEYDKLGRLIRETDPEGGVTEFEYDAVGNIVKKIDALDGKAFYYYDKLNRLDLVIDAEGYATATSYNPTGTVEASTRHYNKVAGVPEVAVRPTVAGHALDATTRFKYDNVGRVVEQTDAEDNVTQFEYDIRGNLVKTVAPGEEAPTSYKYYDKMDRVFLAIDAEGYAARTEYYETTGEVWKVTRRSRHEIRVRRQRQRHQDDRRQRARHLRLLRQTRAQDHADRRRELSHRLGVRRQWQRAV